MKFKEWFSQSNIVESRMFRMVPPEAKALIPKAREICSALTKQYFNQEPIPPRTFIGEFPDPFIQGQNVKIYALSISEFNKNGWEGHGNMGTIDAQAVIHYRIPMTAFDTIYHEIVHACDPKHRKGLSPIVKVQGFQSMLTGHEIDASVAGHIENAKQQLNQLDPQSKQTLLDELATWIKQTQNNDTLNTDNLPKILKGFGSSPSSYHRNPVLWRRFVSILWNELLSKNYRPNFQQPLIKSPTIEPEGRPKGWSAI